MCKCILVFVLLINYIFLTNGARILAYIPSPQYSHQVVFRPLWRELSLRGHQVTLLTTDPIKDHTLTNLTEIDLHFVYEQNDAYITEIIKTNVVSSYKHYLDLFTLSVDMQLEHPSIKELINDPTTKFDVFIGEFHMSSHFALAERFQCPSIGISSLIAVDLTLEKFGVPIHPVVYPHFMVQIHEADSLFKRMFSVYVSIALKLLDIFYLAPLQDVVIRKHFGNDFPSSTEIANKVSLLLENTNPIFDKVRPRTPLAVPIGGIHKVPAKPLPEDLQQVLDSATEGSIYFSLGSNVKSQGIDQSIRQILIEAFSELPYTVFWKFEAENMVNKPNNVYISKWFQQADLLRHPSIKLFITHCGLQSIEESISEHVPMLGMPFIADQHANAEKIVKKGLGLRLDYKTLDKEVFKQTITELIENPKYRNAVTKISDLIQDQPTTGLERAVWWIEYVIRYKGATHLRSPVLDVPWYQYLLLDVVGVILLTLAMLLYVLIWIIRVTRKVIYIICINRKRSKSKEQ